MYQLFMCVFLMTHNLSKKKRIVEALSLFKEMSSKGLTPNVVTYTTLIGGLCIVGMTQAAQELLLEMQIRGQVPNCDTYATLLHGL